MEVQKQKELDYLLGLLQEEAAEIVTEISKARRFGLFEKYNLTTPMNIDRFINEVKDLVTIAVIINNKYDIDFGVDIYDEDHFNTKKDKVCFYSDLSTRLGLLEED